MRSPLEMAGKKRLDLNGMTQKEVADRLGVSTRTVKRWCKGERTPDPVRAEILRGYGIFLPAGKTPEPATEPPKSALDKLAEQKLGRAPFRTEFETEEAFRQAYWNYNKAKRRLLD